MEIKKKIVKEVEETIGYKCDICGEEICVNFPRLDLSTVKYMVLSGGHGEREEEIIKHVCSINCLKKVLKHAYFGADVFLSRKLIEEMIKKEEG